MSLIEVSNVSRNNNDNIPHYALYSVKRFLVLCQCLAFVGWCLQIRLMTVGECPHVTVPIKHWEDAVHIKQAEVSKSGS